MLLTALAWCQVQAEDTTDQDASLKQTVQELVAQLDDVDAAVRDRAEVKLVELGHGVLEHLPPVTNETSEQVRVRLSRVRRAINNRANPEPMRASRLTLKGEMKLSEALAAVEAQTGNRLTDVRAGFGDEAPDTRVKLDFEETPFWTVIDEIMNQAGLILFADYSGEAETLALMSRGNRGDPPQGVVAQNEMFRFEAVQMDASRNLRNPDGQFLRLSLEVTWEPKAAPITLTHVLSDLEILDEKGNPLTMVTELERQAIPVPDATSGLTFDIPLRLPSRSVQRIAKLKGRFVASIPARRTTFEFPNLDQDPGEAQEAERQAEGVTVILQQFRTKRRLRDARILVRFDEADEALQANYSWVYNNRVYLVDPDGNRIAHVGLEGYRQEPGAMGVSYKFDVAGELAGHKLVYVSPVAVRSIPISYTLENIALP